MIEWLLCGCSSSPGYGCLFLLMLVRRQRLPLFHCSHELLSSGGLAVRRLMVYLKGLGAPSVPVGSSAVDAFYLSASGAIFFSCCPRLSILRALVSPHGPLGLVGASFFTSYFSRVKLGSACPGAGGGCNVGVLPPKAARPHHKLVHPLPFSPRLILVISVSRRRLIAAIMYDTNFLVDAQRVCCGATADSAALVGRVRPAGQRRCSCVAEPQRPYRCLTRP